MAEADPGELEKRPLNEAARELTTLLQQGKIDDLQQRVLVLHREKEFLRKRLDKAEKDTHTFSDYFQKEIEKKDLKTTELSEEKERTELEAKQSIRAIKDKTSEQIRKIKEEADSIKIDLSNKLQSAQEEVHTLNTFKDEKKSVEVRRRKERRMGGASPTSVATSAATRK